jgi:DNA-binding NarL/FixJ family response regulator
MPRVLIVDDDPDYRLLVRLALATDPRFELVGEAEDGSMAAAAATLCQADLALLDCSMPGADAFDALPAIRRARPRCRVVLLSGHATEDLRTAAWSSGVLGYLGKDVRPSRLGEELVAVTGMVDAVESVLKETSTQLARDPRSPRVARAFVRRTLESWRLQRPLDTAVLLVSELVTNAVLHAGTDVRVILRLTEHTARVEVADQSSMPPSLPRYNHNPPAERASERSNAVHGRPAEAAASGRGLRMVSSLARRWGTYHESAGGKTVWFELARDGGPIGTGLG